MCFGLSMIDVQFTHECTGIVTAPLVAFYWLDPQCSVVPTLFLDTVIDIFFLVDILVYIYIYWKPHATLPCKEVGKLARITGGIVSRTLSKDTSAM